MSRHRPHYFVRTGPSRAWYTVAFLLWTAAWSSPVLIHLLLSATGDGGLLHLSPEEENTLKQNAFLVLVAASALVAVGTRVLRGRAVRALGPAPEQN